jgi:branched-chain amino acid transport system permease protein
MGSLLQVLLTGLTIGSFYALVALGYTMVYGIVRLINFAHGTLVMVAAFAGWYVLQLPALDEVTPAVGIAIAGVTAVVVTTVVGYLVFRFIYWRLVGKSALGFMIVSLSVALALQEVVRIVFGAREKIYPSVSLSSVSFDLGPVSLNGMDLLVIVLAALLMVAMTWFTNRTSTGFAMRALAVDHDAARLMGVNVKRLVAAAFVIGAALAAVAGVMYGFYYQRISFDMGFALGLKAFTAAVIGGIGNIQGAMLGGLVIGVLEAVVQAYLAGTWSDAIVFGALILVLYVRPSGLLGERVAERV